jgi:uncharacterized repeat protein (TIGR03803 family)
MDGRPGKTSGARRACRLASIMVAGLLALSGAVLAGPPQAELQPARVKQVHSFTRAEGQPVFARMALGLDGRLYGTSSWYGPAGGGTIFRMSTHEAESGHFYWVSLDGIESTAYQLRFVP